MKKFVLHFGWKMKPNPIPYFLLANDNVSMAEEVFELLPGKELSIKVDAKSMKYCVGFSTPKGNRISCPTAEILDGKNFHCASCSLSEFFTCKAICQGDFCNPSSAEAKKHCWNTKAYVYLTSITGKIKVGSSISVIRRWLGQGSDAGVVIAEGVGLEPRALEHHIGSLPEFPLAIRVTQKMKSLGQKINKEKLTAEMEEAINLILSTIKSNILYPKEKITGLTFLDEFHGEINNIEARPMIKTLDESGLDISGEIVGVKGSILVLQNGSTYYATNLNSIIGSYIELDESVKEMKGQKSLFDFV